jgi:hypothetical protein
MVCSEPEAVDDTSSGTIIDASTGIFLTAAVLTIMTGVTTFNNPSQRWRELRVVAESLQSDVFMFRTRAGLYIIDRSEPKRPEERLIDRIQDARNDVVQLASLTESSFVQVYSDKVYCHGQNKDSAADTFHIKHLSKDSPVDMEKGADKTTGRVIDNHHSPMCVTYVRFICRCKSYFN